MDKSKVIINSDARLQITRIANRLKGGYFEKGELYMLAEILQVVGESIEAIERCDWCNEEVQESSLMNETQAGDAICDICAGESS